MVKLPPGYEVACFIGPNPIKSEKCLKFKFTETINFEPQTVTFII